MMMKKILSLVLSLVMIMSALSVLGMITVNAAVPETATVERVVDDGTREINFNENWQFYLATRTPTVNNGEGEPYTGREGGLYFANYGLLDAGDYTTEQIISTDFDDSSWRTLSVPHDFSVEGYKVSSGASGSQGYLQGGLGYYRKTFTVPESFRNESKKIFIDFEGVYQNSVVYLNGREIGKYPSGYTGFSYDLTNLVNYGEANPNVIVVKVQSMSPSGRWYTGSGITRPVKLIVTDAIRITRNGLKLSSPDIETTYKADGHAELNVSASTFSEATNGYIFLRTTVYDADGKVVASNESEPLETNPSNAMTLTDKVTIPNVKLWYTWNTGTPYLYKVKAELVYESNGGGGAYVADCIEEDYGFRWIKFETYNAEDPNQGGLYINDVYTKMNGVDLHADLGSLGQVSYKDAFEYRFELLKEMGVNAYRSAHNPPSREIIEVCSEMGFVVMEEFHDGIYGKATYDFGAFYMQEVPEDWAGFAAYGMASAPKPTTYYDGAKLVWSDWVIQEMVNRDYNEASVIIWSMGNETYNLPARPAWYDGTKYDKLNVITNSETISIYTEYCRLMADIKAIDDIRTIGYGGDSQRRPTAVDANPWGYVTSMVDAFGLNYNSAASVETLMERYAPYNTVFFESESASATSSRGVYFDSDLLNTGNNQTPGRLGASSFDNDNASWTMSFEYSLKKDRDHKAFAGQFIWTGYDYLGEPTPYGVYPVGVSSFGVIDTAGFPKDSFYLYKSQWTDGTTDPMVHIAPMNWDNWKVGENVDVRVYANVKTIELYLNDKLVSKKSFDTKMTDYGKKYYETSEYVADDKSWGSDENPSGYVSTNATVVDASGDSPIAEGAKFGRIFLSWKVPYEQGTLVAKGYNEAGELVAVDTIATSGVPYTVETTQSKKVIAADGTSLVFVECSVVDENGNLVADANNLLKFDVTGGAIVGVDNGQQENAELYKWGNVDRSAYSERTAFMGKALVILQSNKGETGEMVLNISSDKLASKQVKVAVTADGTGEAPEVETGTAEVASVDAVELAVPVGTVPTLPSVVAVNYSDTVLGAYTVNRAVVWDAVDASKVAKAGTFTVNGTVNGISEKAEAVISVENVIEARDISTNTALGNNNRTYDFATLAEDSPIREGALATASFTGNRNNLPNNIVNGDDARTWTNAYSRGANALLPTINASKPADSVEIYWDGVRVAKEIDLTFTVNDRNAVPEDIDVQYWDGENWAKAANQNMVVTENSATITFDPVVSTRVMVYMKNATPYTTTGNITISSAQVIGWNMATDAITDKADVTAPESAVKNEKFDIVVTTEEAPTKLIIRNENGMKITSTVTGIQSDDAGVATTMSLAVGTPGEARVFSVYDGEELIGTFTMAIDNIPTAIISVEAPETVDAGAAFEFTAKTTKDLYKGKLYNDKGGVVKSTLVSRVIDGDYSTSVYSTSIGTAAAEARTFTFKADFDKHSEFPYAYDVQIMVK